MIVYVDGVSIYMQLEVKFLPPRKYSIQVISAFSLLAKFHQKAK